MTPTFRGNNAKKIIIDVFDPKCFSEPRTEIYFGRRLTTCWFDILGYFEDVGPPAHQK